MNFGEALHALKHGKKVKREDWHQPSSSARIFLYYVPAAKYPANRNENSTMVGQYLDDMVPYNAYIALRTSKWSVEPWIPKMSDLLAEDWVVV